MEEFVVDCKRYNADFLVVAETADKCRRAIINVFMNRGERICILKKTYAGNTHDENWQNHLFIMTGDVWEDKLDTISKEGNGWFWDPPILDYFEDISVCVDEWAKYDADSDSYIIYTCQEKEDRLIRKKYRLGYELPKSTAYRGIDGHISVDTDLWDKVACWFAILEYEEDIAG